MKVVQCFFAAAILIALIGCETSTRQLLKEPEQQAVLRSIQTRAFDTTDEQAILRNVIATLQDLGFVLDYANAPLAFVSATKLEGGSARITVSVKRHGEKQSAVRASLQVGLTTVTDPLTYQQFFIALERGMFLTANKIE
jgi:hypothetical protein